MKHWIASIIALLMVVLVSTLALADETTTKGSITALVGNKSTAWGNYQISDKWSFIGDYDDGKLRSGADYEFSDKFRAKAGVIYDDDQSATTGFVGLNFAIPFGNNLKLNGFYDYNYQGKDWSQYEASVKIEMYKNHFINAGVRGNNGSGAEIYDYNEDNDPMLFLRGDFNWQFKKIGVELRPFLLVEGHLLHDYDVTYQLNDRTKFILNVSSLYDKDMKYRAGIEYRF